MRLVQASIGLAICLGLLAACAGDHSGFICNTSEAVFSSADCGAKVAAARCADGGTELTDSAGGGAQTLCCAWLHCESAPFPAPPSP